MNVNIFDMAEQNSDYLRTRYTSLANEYEAQNNFHILNQFVELVINKWTISINMRQYVVNNFLISGRYKNVYEVKKERAGELKEHGREVLVEEGLKSHLKGFYKSRMTFDLTFENGTEFRYSALNIGIG